MIIAFRVSDQTIVESYQKYVNELKEAVTFQQPLEEKVRRFEEIKIQKEKLEARLVKLTGNIEKNWAESDLEEIQSTVVRAKLTNQLFSKGEFQSFLNKEIGQLPSTLFNDYQKLLNRWAPNEYVLFWNIEECEWNALLSN